MKIDAFFCQQGISCEVRGNRQYFADWQRAIGVMTKSRPIFEETGRINIKVIRPPEKKIGAEDGADCVVRSDGKISRRRHP